MFLVVSVSFCVVLILGLFRCIGSVRFLVRSLLSGVVKVIEIR